MFKVYVVTRTIVEYGYTTKSRRAVVAIFASLENAQDYVKCYDGPDFKIEELPVLDTTVQEFIPTSNPPAGDFRKFLRTEKTENQELGYRTSDARIPHGECGSGSCDCLS